MVVQIANDIRYFVVLLGVVLVGFAQAYWFLSSHNKALPFSTVGNALLNAFYYMLGNVDSDFSGTTSPQLATALLVVFMMFMMILMLNLLIALMGNSFAAISEKGLAQWRYEQACIIVDQSLLQTKSALKVPPIVHVLKYREYAATTADDRSLSTAGQQSDGDNDKGSDNNSVLLKQLIQSNQEIITSNQELREQVAMLLATLKPAPPSSI